jgi:hypothetical protein
MNRIECSSRRANLSLRKPLGVLKGFPRRYCYSPILYDIATYLSTLHRYILLAQRHPRHNDHEIGSAEQPRSKEVPSRPQPSHKDTVTEMLITTATAAPGAELWSIASELRGGCCAASPQNGWLQPWVPHAAASARRRYANGIRRAGKLASDKRQLVLVSGGNRSQNKTENVETKTYFSTNPSQLPLQPHPRRSRELAESIKELDSPHRQVPLLQASRYYAQSEPLPRAHFPLPRIKR